MRVTAKGQVTIPAAIRERFGLLPDTEVEFVVDGETVRLTKAETAGDSRGRRVVARLRGRARTGMTTDEILALTRQP
ncbi:MAG: AbrB/MazE/SpoVT family DNA-binding domain-containing protein [Micromonosporaceae bacterium]|nr:AbrB/MazE/SpoVT family DNA-binding domain-containing protein [Micromonosporaceae bacterium]